VVAVETAAQSGIFEKKSFIAISYFYLFSQGYRKRYRIIDVGRRKNFMFFKQVPD